MKKGLFNNEVYYTPKTFNQIKYVELLNNQSNDLIVAIGPAGCGKTMFACLKAIESLKKNTVSKIIITRPVVPVEEDIGFLPGNIVKKMDPWTRPIFDIFLEYYTQNEITQMINNGIIEISPLAYMRGRTFKNAFIIADEMQNSSPNQMLMLSTRIGLNSRMVVTGDLQQSDKFIDNGLKDFIIKYEVYSEENNYDINEIKIIKLNTSDVMRSVIVEKVLKMYNFKKTFNANHVESSNSSKSNFSKGNSSNGNSSNGNSSKDNYNNDAALIPVGQFHGGF
jgi:phosphate starvation-inducible PhoH-like protein